MATIRPTGWSLLLSLVMTGCGDQPSVPPPVRVAPVPQAQFADPDRAARLLAAAPALDSVVRAFLERARVPGAAWGLIIDGALVHTGVAGLRDIEAGAPVDRGTVFRIASMTKSFTALAILRLRDAGRLSLDDPADRYVPALRDLGYPTGDSPRITIRHLLSHATGFPEDNPWGDQQLDATDAAMDAMMRSGIPFSSSPGLHYEYSNFGFAILGQIVTAVSGMPYNEFLRREVLDPLGMTSTTMEAAEVPAERLALGYRWEDARWKLEPPLPDGAFGPMGGMLTSLDDLGRWVGFLLGAWPPSDAPDDGPARRASVREMQQIARARPATVSRGADGTIGLNAGGYGFGLGISQSCGFGHVVAHSGGLPGYGSQMRWLPEYGVGLIGMGNLTYTGWGGVFTEALAILAATGALQPRQPQPSPALVDLREAVTRLVINWSDPLADSVAAMNLYRDEARERRRAQAAALVEEVGGACRADGPFLVENALRGRWRLHCAMGALEVGITLAPIVPPKVQFLSVRRVDPATPLRPAPACPGG